MKLNLSVPNRLRSSIDILLFAVCLFGANIVWKWAIDGDETDRFVTLFGMDVSPFFNECARLLAERCAWWIGIVRPTLTYFPPDMFVFDSGFTSTVAWGCTAIKQSFIWLIIMLFTRGKQWRKLWFIPMGWAVTHCFNVMRISLINIFCEFHPMYFDFWHTYVFKYLFYLVLFLMWVWWVESIGKTKEC